MAELVTDRLTHLYAAHAGLRQFSHRFAAGKITTVLGPSGSGKSTLLHLLAGLLAPDAGTVCLDGQDITGWPAERRDFGLVFQDYLLFPHLTVAENVGFGLKVRRVPAGERRRRVEEALELLRIGPLAGRRIREISGGERQRVAIARAIVFRPKVLLLDEPLSALDAGLRHDLRHELGALLGGLGLTTVYVTHDRMEALSLGHETIVLRGGEIEQAGSPAQIYREPASAFVATFLGSANLLPAEGRGGMVALPFGQFAMENGGLEGPCWALVRPLDLELVPAGTEGAAAAQIEAVHFLGDRFRIELQACGQRLTAEIAEGGIIPPLGVAALKIRPRQLRVLPRPPA